MEAGHYLRCDRAGCGHRETVPAITVDMIGRPCPDCGDSLLTAADFAHWQNVVSPQLVALQVLEAAAVEAGIVSVAAGKVTVNLHHHNGETTLKISENRKAEQ